MEEQCFYQNVMVIVKNQRVLTANLNNAEGFEYLFFIAGPARKVDDLIEKNKNGQVFIKLKSKRAMLVKESIYQSQI